MNRFAWTLALVVGASLVSAEDVSAQDVPPPPPASEPTNQPVFVEETPAADPAYEQQPQAAQQPGPAQPEPYQQPNYAPGSRTVTTTWNIDQPQVQLGAALGVPIWYGDQDFLSAGVGLDVFGAVDFGYVAIEVRGGWQWQQVDLGPDVGRRVSRTTDLQRSWFGIGAKGEFHNASPLTPWIGGSFDFNFWNLAFETETVCGFYYCYEDEVWRFTPGFSGRAGVSLQPGPRLSVDLGLEVGMTFQGRVFPERESWVKPFLGVTLYQGEN